MCVKICEIIIAKVICIMQIHMKNKGDKTQYDNGWIT